MKGNTLLFDFSNMAIRAMYSCCYNEVGVGTFDTENECEILVRKLTTDITYVMRLFSPERTVLLCDSKSPWRRKLFSDIEGEEYKGNRTKDTTKNWDNIFNAFEECKTYLKKSGVLVNEIKDAEADDLAALWREHLWSEKNNCILVSSDKDWTQLVGFNGENYCICFNPIANNQQQKIIYYTQDYMDWLQKPADDPIAIMFSNNLGAKYDIMSVAATKDGKIVRKVIDPMAVLVDKIMCGDDGDNIPAFYVFYKNGKKTRVTEKRKEKILESIASTSVFDLQVHAKDGSLKKSIESCFKIDIDDMDTEERLERQRKMVELNPLLFPRNVVTAFGYFIEDSKNDGYAKSISLTMQEVLKGSKYVMEGYNKPKSNSIFDNLKGLEKYIGATPSPNPGFKFEPEKVNKLF